MRNDQIERLRDLQDKLCEVVLTDADPQNWTGNGRPPCDLEQQERGDAYWCRKMAVSSLSVFTRVVETLQKLQGVQPVAPPTEDDHLDQHVARAEREAAKLLHEMQDRAKRKQTFDTKTHGKA